VEETGFFLSDFVFFFNYFINLVEQRSY